jgi:V/A-type H+-transporting ATPase subunit I
MQEKLKSFGIIASKLEIEEISKKLLDSSKVEIIPLDDILDEKLEKELITNNMSNPYLKVYDNFMYIFNAVKRVPEPKTHKINFPAVVNESEIEEFSNKLKADISKLQEEIASLSVKREELKSDIDALEKIKNIDIDIADLNSMTTLKYKIGRINKLYYSRLLQSVEDKDIFIVKLSEDEQSVWIFVIYAANLDLEKFFSLANFSEHKLHNHYEGKPKEVLWEVWDEYRALDYEIQVLEKGMNKIFFENRRFIYKYFDLIFVLKNIYDMYQYYKFSENFFLISGWTTEDIYMKLQKEYEEKQYVVFMPYKPKFKAPTLLKNKGFFKHFEFIVRMFGLPSSDEIDPTPFVAIIFMLFFGMMFGDVGHGLVLVTVGFWIYYKKKSDLFFVIGSSGIVSVIFGFLYGSFFGFENVIQPLWARPMDRIDYFLLLSIYMGIAMITFGMILNIINRLKRKEGKELLFDSSGLNGLSIYWILLGSIFYWAKNGVFPIFTLYAVAVLAVVIYIGKLMTSEGKFSDRLVEGFFELFEVFLSYMSNTMSFVRLGAFAMNHAGLFMAFYVMAQMSGNSISSFIILLFANLLILTLEALVVFIQALRLEYYEFFIRFFHGDGREFKPIKYKF